MRVLPDFAPPDSRGGKATIIAGVLPAPNAGTYKFPGRYLSKSTFPNLTRPGQVWRKAAFLLDRARPVLFLTRQKENGGCIPCAATRRNPRPRPPGRSTHLIFNSFAISLRLMVRILETPCSCMVTPYSTSASSMVPRRWVMTMNCVRPARVRI